MATARDGGAICLKGLLFVEGRRRRTPSNFVDARVARCNPFPLPNSPCLFVCIKSRTTHSPTTLTWPSTYFCIISICSLSLTLSAQCASPAPCTCSRNECLCVCMYILALYTYTYVEKESERAREREGERNPNVRTSKPVTYRCKFIFFHISVGLIDVYAHCV